MCHTCLCVYIHIHIHVHKHVHVHIYIHIHIQDLIVAITQLYSGHDVDSKVFFQCFLWNCFSHWWFISVDQTDLFQMANKVIWDTMVLWMLTCHVVLSTSKLWVSGILLGALAHSHAGDILAELLTGGQDEVYGSSMTSTWIMAIYCILWENMAVWTLW